jgi:hypothetical protein
MRGLSPPAAGHGANHASTAITLRDKCIASADGRVG